MSADEFTGRFFKISLLDANRYSSSCDVVYVAACGSFACTSPFYANTGMLSKHILSVFRCGYISVNVVSHLHPLYVEAHALTLACSDAELLQKFTCSPSIIKRPDKLIRVTTSVSWKWCVTYTANAWKEVGLGGESHLSTVFPVPDPISTAPESMYEQLKKDIQKLVPILRCNSAERGHFYEYLAKLQERAQAEALVKDKARRRIFDVELNDVAAITTTMPSDKSRKRKVSGSLNKISKKNI